MGTYTGLGVHAIVKQEYRELVGVWLAATQAPPYPRWELLLAMLQQQENDGILYFDGSGQPEDSQLVQGLRVFLQDQRANFIGFSHLREKLCVDDWGNINDYDPLTGRWVFTCALKDYDCTIDLFLCRVLVPLSSEIVRIQRETDGGWRRTIHTVAIMYGAVVYTSWLTETDTEQISPAEEFCQP